MRAVYIELLPDQTADQFIPYLKKFVARRGRPNKIYSDNVKTFTATAKWIRGIMKDEKLNEFLVNQSIVWQFNLSRTPWWGGQFERIIGLTNQATYIVIGNARLKLNELEEFLLDVEITVNNRPLSYVEDDVQLPLLTPNMMLLGQKNALLEQEVTKIKDKDLRRRAKYLQRCTDNLWRRWKAEYLRTLRERHNLKFKDREPHIAVGEVVPIRGDEKNRGQWSIGVVERLIKGKDDALRGARLKTSKSHVQRAVQLLCPLNCPVM